MLSLNNLCVKYENFSVLQNISFELKESEIITIVGESGSGKSSLINSIIGFLPNNAKIYEGSICYNEKNITNLDFKSLQEIRGKEITLIFQEPGSTLNPVRKIGVQFYETLKYHFKMTTAEAKEQALICLKKTNLDNILKKYPFELSGGMKQRVSIAMAISLNPKIILADEPTSAVDLVNQREIANEFLKMKKNNTSFIVVTHDLEFASYISDRIIILKNGKILEQGDKNYIMKTSSSKYIGELIESIPKIKES